MATLSTIIGGLQTALTTGDSPVFAASNCFFAFNPKNSLKYPPSDQFAVIQPGSLEVGNRVFKGGGNISYTISWKATIWLLVRSVTDPYNQENSYLLNETTGSLTLTDSVMAAIQDYSIADGDNLFGYQLDNIEFPDEEKSNVGWAITKMHFHTDITGR